MSRVGFIGVGVMGMPMALNLIEKGHRVKAFDISPAALEAIGRKGAETAASPRDAAEGADFVITMLPTGKVVAYAVFGPEGAAESLGDDSLLIEMSTGLPSHFDMLAERLTSQGKRAIDAPVGRTSREAETGTLLIMVGGETEDVERARPVLECMGDTIIHCGATGSGIRTKLVNNYLSIVSNVVVAEALALAESAGLDRDTAIDALMGTTAGRGHLGTTYPVQVLAGNLDPGFMVDLARKDLGLALEMGRDNDSPTVMGAAALPVYDDAQLHGLGGQDWTAVYNLVAGRTRSGP